MKSAAVMYLTGPGVPFIYYGEEIGMTGRKPDEYIRTPMQWSDEENAGFTTGTPWIDVNSTYEDWNVAAQADDPDSLLLLYRQLVAMRNEHVALRNGDTYKVDASANEVYTVLRVAGDEAVLVVMNLGDETLKDYQLSMSDSPLRGHYTLEPLLGEGQTAPLAVSDEGGFSDYQPLAQLLPGESVVLMLQPVP
jgi:glycosidase